MSSARERETGVWTLGELFAGVGGFSLGFDRAGFRTLWQVEWDKNCQQVLARHWPMAVRYGDVSCVHGNEIDPVDVITFGSPCQDLSTAGKRAGLQGGRSGMFFEAVRIIREMRDATNGEFPRVVVWENVAGAFTSNGGADYEAVLRSLADLGSCHIEWHCLDAQWFGVPQRRRRVFVTAVLDPSVAERCGEQIFPVASRSGWCPPPCKGSGEGDADGIDGGSRAGGKDRSDPDHLITSAYDEYNFSLGGETHHLLRSVAHSTGALQTISFGWQENYYAGDTHHEVVTALTTTKTPAIHNVHALRRLTPLECERLMGWDDDHTRWFADGTEQSDAHRYKQCGNGVVANVTNWLAIHIARVLKG